MKYIFFTLMCLTNVCSYSQTKGVTILSTNSPQLTTNTYAVVVGISDYQNPEIPDLRFANKDAEAFANFLKSDAGGHLDNDHIKLLINAQATMAQFASALDWLWDVCKEGDQAIIYFSGHGDVEKKSLTQPGFLLCWDAPARVYMAGGAFALPMLQEVVSTLSVQNKAKVIVITDACRSGTLAGSSVGGSQATAANLAKQFANEIKIMSCQPNEYSIEGEQWGGGRGAFSYHLLEALYGMADNNNDLWVTLQEVGRYLEDHVPNEVAPLSQVPMTLGNRTERLSKVDANLLASLKSGKSNQLMFFSAIDSKGIEEDVIANVDTNTRKIYALFKDALKHKIFLEPAEACADSYYRLLIKAPGLERLQSSMKRNFAAALQDDAQQVMNTLITSGLTKEILTGESLKNLYSNYPNYLQRAAELLGESHYMYKTLMARKYYFLGKMQGNSIAAQKALNESLKWDSNLPHTYAAFVITFDAAQQDSAHYYATKALDLLPKWVEPHIQLYWYYKKLGDPIRAEEMLKKAGEIDSNSVLVWYLKGHYYAGIQKYNLAIKWLEKAVSSSHAVICFPCAFNSLGYSYLQTGQLELAEKNLMQALKMDSTHVPTHINLGNLYGQMGQLEKAEMFLLKTIQLDSLNAEALNNLGIVNAMSGRMEQSAAYFLRSLKVDPYYISTYSNLAQLYMELRKFEDAEALYKKAIRINGDLDFIHYEYGILFKLRNNTTEAIAHLQKAIQINPDHIESAKVLVGLYLENGSLEQAHEILLSVEKKFSNDAMLKILFARWAVRNKDDTLALKYLAEALQQKGFAKIKREIIEGEADFQELRNSKEWNELITRHFPKKE